MMKWSWNWHLVRFAYLSFMGADMQYFYLDPTSLPDMSDLSPNLNDAIKSLLSDLDVSLGVDGLDALYEYYCNFDTPFVMSYVFGVKERVILTLVNDFYCLLSRTDSWDLYVWRMRHSDFNRSIKLVKI